MHGLWLQQCIIALRNTYLFPAAHDDYLSWSDVTDWADKLAGFASSKFLQQCYQFWVLKAFPQLRELLVSRAKLGGGASGRRRRMKALAGVFLWGWG